MTGECDCAPAPDGPAITRKIRRAGNLTDLLRCAAIHGARTRCVGRGASAINRKAGDRRRAKR